MAKNCLYYGDNLEVMRKYIKDETVDLIYLDPPFNSNKAYNIIFEDQTGEKSSAQIQAFEDTWFWSQETQSAFDEIMTGKYSLELKETVKAFRDFMGESNLMAYLTMMAIRLVEMHRVLKGTGSIFLHCDPTASHYLKVLLDQIFGIGNFKNEIVWKRTSGHSDRRGCGNTHDILLFYCKSNQYTWNQVYQEYDEKYVKSHYTLKDEDGRVFRADNLTAGGLSGGGYKYEWNGVTRVWRLPKSRMEELDSEGRVYYTRTGVASYKRYLDEMPGVPVQDVWIDIPPVNPASKEKLGFPTQKPLPLLERIVRISSNEGDVVLDPFCGCGTAIAAAEKLGRKWIGIDITHLAVSLIKKRIVDHFPDAKFDVIGEPRSTDAAEELFKQSPFQFEAWAVSLLGGQPYKSTGGGDTGMDGFLYFRDYENGYHKIILEVKGGGYQPKDVRALARVLEREKAPMGVLIALKKPTKGMLKEAAALGKWAMPGSKKSYPVLQIMTIEDYFDNRLPELPDTSETLKRAKREARESEKNQPKLL